MELEIKQEFFNLIPPLSQDEVQSLILSLRTEGCRQPIIVWKGKNIIVDGHNRYAICTKLKIPFKVEDMEFKDENEVMIWMINNQFARRNLSLELRLDLTYKLREVEQKQAQERMLAGKKIEDKKTLGVQDTPGSNKTLASCEARVAKKGKTLSKVAEKAGVSRATVERYDTIQRKGTDEQKEAVRSGKKKIGTVYKEIQAKEKPTEKSQDNNWNIYELFRSKFADKYLQKYVLIYDVKVNDTQHIGTISNCNDYERIKRHADSIMGMINVICDKDDISNLRKALQKVISKFVIQKVEYEERDNGEMGSNT